jgi:hypothetical protein
MNVDSLRIAEVTHHKDPKMLVEYHDSNDATKIVAANVIGNQVSI